MINLGLGLLLGLILGSLVDCIANRSLGKQSFWGRSYCDYCKKVLAWYDLFPVLSFLWNRGKCRFCHKKLSLEYPIFELITGALIALLFYIYVPANFLTLPLMSQILVGADLLFKTFVIGVLLAVIITDLKKGLIPDRITYPVFVITLVYLVVITIFKAYLIYNSIINSAIGKYLLPPHSSYFTQHVIDASMPLILGLATSLGVGLFFLALILITRGRGMGGGDMKLGFFLGLAFGFPQAIVVLMLSFLTGALLGIGLILIGKRKFGQTIPFGPFLALGGILSVLWGEQILNFYLNLKL